ncbi:MAG: cation-translocating P-type ATPase [Coriobacteriia bacterium]|nr:cation-translocating P-type ATPase [Coriobacteriia bacterium]
MQWIEETIEEVLKQQTTSTQTGLSSEEVNSRREKFGYNEFDEAKKETILQKVLQHLTEITAIILLGAAAIAAYMAITSGEGWAKVWVIMSIVVINTALGIYQESKAEAALDALKKMNSFTTTVLRDGIKLKVDAREVVPGDIVELTAGDVITADARLIEVHGLTVEEAALTGESVPVEKDPSAVIEESVPLGDRVNMVYSGCLVTNGRGLAVVVETGMNTEMGKIANLLNTTKKQKTPLQRRVGQIASRLCAAALTGGAIMFAVGYFRDGYPIPDLLLAAVSLGVAAVPETMPIIVTMTLSYGVWKMVRRNTIIRKIPAVETVGNTSVICSDKTGTLTQNKMAIQKVWSIDHDVKSADDEFGSDERYLIELMTACSNASIEVYEGSEKAIGDPTELAIIRLLKQKGLTRAELNQKFPRIHEIPFDSSRKRMTTVHHVGDQYWVITKGAFDRIPVTWTSNLKKEASTIHDYLAKDALRVIALGLKKYDYLPDIMDEESLERDQTLVGLVGMIDPPRPESKQAVACAKEAGIKTVMVTGDHVETAKAIARDIGIYQESDLALTGLDLDNMTDDELFEKVRSVSVYARVSPEDKLRIVQAWSKQGEVVAMTGDGVNDAPALKQADIGVAMGITGTEVTKSAADMVIADDNFATIVDAIAAGRTAYDNIRKTVYFLLAVNFSQIFIMLISALLPSQWGWPLPIIMPLQILLINVISDGIPGLFLSFEKAERNIMKRPPLPKAAGVFASSLGAKIALRAATFTALTLGAFALGSWALAPVEGYDPMRTGITMAFIALAWMSAINVLNIRSEDSLFRPEIWRQNKGMILAVLGSMSITVLVATIPPVARIFEAVPLTGMHWLALAGITALLMAVSEIQKLIGRLCR